ncbi:NAD(P)H-binding protein [Pedobacter duraquae]|uniref:Uncharacterized protein YbjT (DUF2867 family) n=1 Tax=Pedobacter duraquae TaxID=425511 RepID=A0A4R6IK77_9SPHI|nr:NAD(P)H-binding protein [Pedobacter duraquae]TDO22460.1 uncharacterized protein YbjT (DUF2867 family) [Pedobacter duraquae]
MEAAKKKAVIVGASGLIGSELLDLLLKNDSYAEVLSLVRKEKPIQHPKLTQIVVDFEQLATYSNLITGHTVFSCLGTTKKQTPDTQLYYKIDHDYPVLLARLAAANQVAQFHYVSAPGADSKSLIFYSRTKGDAEADLKKSGIRTLYLYQPSLLTGERKEHRFMEQIAERIMKVIDPVLVGSWKKYRSISGKSVALAMLRRSLVPDVGVFTLASDQIQEIADADNKIML